MKDTKNVNNYQGSSPNLNGDKTAFSTGELENASGLWSKLNRDNLVELRSSE